MLEQITKNKALAFVILIGGKSTRFGTDKGIYEFQGKPLISYQLDILANCNKDIFLVAHSTQQIKNYIEKIDYRKIIGFITDDLNILSDKELRIPMLGIYSALKELKALNYKNAFILSCDMPMIKREIIKLLIKHLKDFDCCIPRWENGFLEPLFAIYSVDKTLKRARQNLENKTFKLTNLIDENWKVNYISIEHLIKPLDKDLRTFININGPIDVEKLMIKKPIH
ncbi:MAG: molybdenum cofactor guanylyltransferase [Promethearchaeota archaeon]